MREECLRDRGRVAGNHIDDAGRHAGRLIELHQVVGREHRARRGLPDDGVAHQRRRGRQVRGNRCEIERRDRVDESFEAAIFQLIPHRVVAERLLTKKLLAVVDVEAPEVDDLARRVDLRLKDRLRLPEHRRGVDGVAPRGCQELRRLQQDRGTVVERPACPFFLRRACRGNRVRDVRFRRLVKAAEHVLVVVRHHDLATGARLDFFAADEQRNLDDFARHLRETRLDRGALGRAGCVGLDRVVDRRWHAAVPVEGGKSG